MSSHFSKSMLTFSQTHIIKTTIQPAPWSKLYKEWLSRTQRSAVLGPAWAEAATPLEQGSRPGSHTLKGSCLLLKGL